jgi:hypothetical protein
MSEFFSGLLEGHFLPFERNILEKTRTHFGMLEERLMVCALEVEFWL